MYSNPLSNCLESAVWVSATIEGEAVIVKVTIDIEATPQEMREFLGLPDLRPLQDELIQAIRDNMNQGVAGFEPLTLMKPLFPAQMQSMELLHKAFWDAFNNRSDAEASKADAAKTSTAKARTGTRKSK